MVANGNIFYSVCKWNHTTFPIDRWPSDGIVIILPRTDYENIEKKQTSKCSRNMFGLMWKKVLQKWSKLHVIFQLSITKKNLAMHSHYLCQVFFCIMP